MKTIKLTQGKETLVDDEDYGFLSQWKWGIDTRGYARRNIGNKTEQKTILMHTVIMQTPEGFMVDHINRNKLDNQKKNLRICISSQNLRNQKKRIDNTLGIKGVHWRKDHNRWQARIMLNQKTIHLGYFKTLQGAWLARRWGERIYFKEFRPIGL